MELTIPGEPANLERAAARGERLWAVELDDHRWPTRAHAIDQVLVGGANNWPTAYITACGSRFDVRFAGCYARKEGELPLPESHVHCLPGHALGVG